MPAFQGLLDEEMQPLTETLSGGAGGSWRSGRRTVFWGGPAQEASAQLMVTTLVLALDPFSECISEKSGAWSSRWRKAHGADPGRDIPR